MFGLLLCSIYWANGSKCVSLFWCDETVEQVEPVVVAVVHQTIEFALCCLEKWIGKSDDSSLQVCDHLWEETSS